MMENTIFIRPIFIWETLDWRNAWWQKY